MAELIVRASLGLVEHITKRSDELSRTERCYLPLLFSFPMCFVVWNPSADCIYEQLQEKVNVVCRWLSPLSFPPSLFFSPMHIRTYMCSFRLCPKWITLGWKSLCQKECCSTTVIWLAFQKAGLTRAQGSGAAGKWLSPALSVLHLAVHLERASKGTGERAKAIQNTICLSVWLSV